MSSIQYNPLSYLTMKFNDIKDGLEEEFRSSDISWGCDKQLTMVHAEYLYDIIDEHIRGKIDDLIETIAEGMIKAAGEARKRLRQSKPWQDL